MAVLACVLHKRHVPQSAWIELHHIQPLGMGGPDVPENKAAVCPTGHYNVHSYMAWMLFGSVVGAPAPGHTATEAAMATDGVKRWTAAGKPGNPHAAYGLHGHG